MRQLLSVTCRALLFMMCLGFTDLAVAQTITVSSPNGGENWTEGSTHSVTWSISGSTSNINYQLVAYSTNGGSSYTNVSVALTPGSRSYSWTLPSGVTSSQVRVRVRALDVNTFILAEDTSNSNFTISSTAPAFLPGAPQNLAWQAGNGQIFLGWQAPASNGGAAITSYRVLRSTNGSTSALVTSGGCANLGVIFACTDTGLTNGQSYTYFVTAVNSVGQGPPSNPATATPTGAVNVPTVTGYAWTSTPTDRQNFSGTITGAAFISGIRVFFCVNGSSTCYEHGQAGIMLNGSGSLSVSNVNLGAGSYQIYVQTTGGTSTRSTAFTVGTSNTTQPVLGVSPGSGPSGTAFRFTGSNFTRSTTATLTVTRPDGSFGGSGRYSTDSNGNVSFVITSQSNDPLGQWTFRLNDDGGKSASTTAQYTSTQQSGADSMYYTDSTVDVNYPDGAQITAMSPFTKIWRLQNNGTSTWNGYTAVFISNPSNGNPSINLHASGATSVSVPLTSPGQTINLSIPMKAPSPGTYYSYWQLQNTNGVRFGKQFYVKIRVVAKQGNALGFGTQSGQSGTNDSPPGRFATNSDPVNTATGNYNYAGTDLRVPGRGLDVEISRSYNSQDTTAGPLGNGWSHSFNIYLANQTSNSASVHYSDGKVLDYVNQPGTSNFISSYPGVYDTLIHNADGTWTLRKSDQRSYQFDAAGKLTTIRDKVNNQISLSYAGGNLSQVTDTVGRAFNFSYSGLLLTSITDPAGRYLQFNYDGGSNLISFRDANGNTNSYSYDSSNQLTRIIDGRGNNLLVNTYKSSCPAGVATCVDIQANGRGNQWSFVYNSDGSTSVFDPLNKESKYVQDVNFNIQQMQDRNANSQFASGPINLVYDENNNRARTSDAKGNYAAYVYDGNGNITNRTDPSLNVRQADYDAKNNPTRITDELGKPTEMAYDNNGNLISLTDALGNSATTTYDSFGQPLTVTDAGGNVTTRTYDAQGNLISVRNALNQTITYAYDAIGRRTRVTDARGKVTQYTYDSNDNLLTVTDPLGNVTSNNYDANNNRISTRDPRGNITSYSYDENNLLLKEIDPKGNFVQHTYDKLDRRISTRDKRGNVTNFTYDNEGRLLTVTDPLTGATSYTYDANGNRTKITDAKGQSTTFTYDALNRVTKIQDALGNVIQKEYDRAGRLTRETDPNGNATQFIYDDVGNLNTVTDATAGTAKYSYDKNRNRITQTDPNNHTANLAYDKLNRLLSSTDALNRTSSSTYDESGNRVTGTDAKGQTTRYGYDGVNRLILITYPDNSTVQLTRDANGNVTRMVDSLGTTTCAYDELNRLTSTTGPFGKSIGYQYDENGNITRLIYPDAKQVNYQYDANNRMISLTDWAGKTTSYQYDIANLLTKVTYPNGIVTSMGYDNAGRLISKSDSGISSYSFTLDKNGNRVGASITQPLGVSLQNSSQTYAYDAANQIKSAGAATFGFDANGNMTNKTEAGTATNYSYDFENRLISISGSSQYFYNGEGVRLQRIEGTQTTRYVVDTNHQLSQVLCETDTNGAITSYFVYGMGLAYKVTPEGTHYHYHYDPIGSTVAITNDFKNVINSYAYDPFGKMTNSIENVENPFQFVGEFGVTKEIHGLVFMRARFYVPELGRFLNRDSMPIEERVTQTLNLFIYTNNMPISLIDPEGKWPSLSDFKNGFGSLYNNTKDALKSIGEEVIITGGTSVVKGISFAYKSGYRELPYFQGAIKGTIKANLGGTNILKAVKGGLEDFLITKGLDAIEGKRKEIPFLSSIPWFGKVLFRYGEAGETIDEQGNIYVGGKLVGNLSSSGITVQSIK